MAQSILEASVGETAFEVKTAITIRAQYHRVFSVLTTPEHLTAWFSSAEVDGVECLPDKHALFRFQMKLHRQGLEQRHIHGSCFLSRQCSVTYLWSENSRNGKFISRVSMELRSGPRRCRLKLRHQGLCSETESAYYAGLWQSSLQSLRQLLEPSGSHGRIQMRLAPMTLPLGPS